MPPTYREEKIWSADSNEYELHRNVKIGAEQGHYICIEKYGEDYCREAGSQRAILDLFEVDERYFYLASRAYLESVGFKVSKS